MVNIQKTKEIPWGAQLQISSLAVASNTPKQYFNQFKANSSQDTSDEDIVRAVNNLIIENTVFNSAMDLIVTCYEITYENSDLLPIVEKFRQNFKSLATAPDAYLFTLALNTIIKEKIFEDVAKELKIEVTDEDVKQTLEIFYKKTNISIHEELNNKEKFNTIKSELLEKRIIQSIVSRFNPVFNWETINKQFTTLQYK